MRALSRWALPALASLLLAAFTSTGCAPKRPWNQILLLEHPEHGKQAEQALRKMGPEGWRAVLQATRAVGQNVVFIEAFRLNKCPALGFPTTGDPVPGEAAVRLALRWMAEEPAVAEGLERSSSPIERSLALMRWIGQPAELVQALEALESEQSQDVLSVALVAVDCGMLAAARAKKKPEPELVQALLVNKVAVAKRLAQVLERRVASPGQTASPQPKLVSECRKPATEGGDALLAHLLGGRLKLGGTSVSNGVMSIQAQVGGQSVAMGPQCAGWLYEQAAIQGTYQPGLLVPLVGQMAMLDPTLRAKAAERLARDLDHFPAQDRNKLLARAVNAGAASDVRVTWDRDAYFPQTLELEAAARQGSAEAKGDIAQAMLCRSARSFATSGPVPLLGFLPAAEVADLAFRVGKECRDGPSAALIALLRLGDPRATQLLEGILTGQDRSLDDDLFYGLAEYGSAEVVSHLERAGKAGNRRAARLLEHIKAARVSQAGGGS